MGIAVKIMKKYLCKGKNYNHALFKMLSNDKFIFCFIILGKSILFINCDRSHIILCFINKFSIWIFYRYPEWCIS